MYRRTTKDLVCTFVSSHIFGFWLGENNFQLKDMLSAYAEKAVGSHCLFRVPLKHKSKGNQKDQKESMLSKNIELYFYLQERLKKLEEDFKDEISSVTNVTSPCPQFTIFIFLIFFFSFMHFNFGTLTCNGPGEVLHILGRSFTWRFENIWISHLLF